MILAAMKIHSPKTHPDTWGLLHGMPAALRVSELICDTSPPLLPCSLNEMMVVNWVAFWVGLPRSGRGRVSPRLELTHLCSASRRRGALSKGLTGIGFSGKELFLVGSRLPLASQQ